jgi:hypothetical protein
MNLANTVATPDLPPESLTRRREFLTTLSVAKYIRGFDLLTFWQCGVISVWTYDCLFLFIVYLTSPDFLMLCSTGTIV